MSISVGRDETQYGSQPRLPFFLYCMPATRKLDGVGGGGGGGGGGGRACLKSAFGLPGRDRRPCGLYHRQDVSASDRVFTFSIVFSELPQAPRSQALDHEPDCALLGPAASDLQGTDEHGGTGPNAAHWEIRFAESKRNSNCDEKRLADFAHETHVAKQSMCFRVPPFEHDCNERPCNDAWKKPWQRLLGGTWQCLLRCSETIKNELSTSLLARIVSDFGTRQIKQTSPEFHESYIKHITVCASASVLTMPPCDGRQVAVLRRYAAADPEADSFETTLCGFGCAEGSNMPGVACWAPLVSQNKRPSQGSGGSAQDTRIGCCGCSGTGGERIFSSFTSCLPFFCRVKTFRYPLIGGLDCWFWEFEPVVLVES